MLSRVHETIKGATRWRVGIQVLATMYQCMAAGFFLFAPPHILMTTPLFNVSLGLREGVFFASEHYVGAALLSFLGAVCATISLVGDGRLQWPLRMFLLMPQQYFLLATMFGEVPLIARGRFAIILLCLMYSVAIFHDAYLRIATHSVRSR